MVNGSWLMPQGSPAGAPGPPWYASSALGGLHIPLGWFASSAWGGLNLPLVVVCIFRSGDLHLPLGVVSIFRLGDLHLPLGESPPPLNLRFLMFLSVFERI